MSTVPGNDDPAGAAPPRRIDEDVLLRQHGEELRQLFPVPDARSLRRRAPSAKAVVPLLLVMVMAGLGWQDPAFDRQIHASAAGERRSVELADGSRITLDAGSRIVVQRHLRSRQVVLERGRARFEVAPSRWRPFRVDAGQAEVRVLGTVFDLHRDGRAFDVGVHRGVVSVAVDGGIPQRLVAGQWLQAVKGRTQMRGREPGRDDAWLGGRIEFSGTPLAEALAELQRHRRGTITLDDPALADLPISGVFDADRVDAALDLLPGILPVRVVRHEDGRVHVRAR